jgi:ABC-2 type transport system permease protein
MNAVTIAIQSLIIVGLGLAVGARFPGGVAGFAVLVLASVVLASAVGALSVGLALVARQEETVIGAVQMVVLPASFLSAVLMKQELAPGWVQTVARFNPVNWAVDAGRAGLGASVDWGLVASRLGLLALLAVFCGWVATRAFRGYQRSV